MSYEKKMNKNMPFDITDLDLDNMAQPYEEGTWVGCLGHVWLERPRIHQCHQEDLSLQLPEKLMDGVRKKAISAGMRPGDMIRQTLSTIVEGELASSQKVPNLDSEPHSQTDL